jgi:hypothetical protein
VLAFYRVGGARGIGGWGVNAGVNGFNAIEDGGGFKRGIKGGKMKARWLQSGGTRGVELGGAWWPGSYGGTGELRRLEVGDGADSWGRLTERRGRGGHLRKREPKGKTYFHEDATHARARWAGRGSFGLRGQRGQRAGWAKGRVGRKVSRAESKEKEFLN